MKPGTTMFVHCNFGSWLFAKSMASVKGRFGNYLIAGIVFGKNFFNEVSTIV